MFSFINRIKSRRLLKPLMMKERKSLAGTLMKQLKLETGQIESMVKMFSENVIKKSRIGDICLNLPPSCYLESPNFIESQVLDCWVVTYSFIKSFGDRVPQEDLFKLLDAAHRATADCLLSLQWNEKQIEQLALLSSVRYSEYDESFTAFLLGKRENTFDFSRAVIRNIFDKVTTEDFRLKDSLLLCLISAHFTEEVLAFVEIFNKTDLSVTWPQGANLTIS